jgi:hypothetical protein
MQPLGDILRRQSLVFARLAQVTARQRFRRGRWHFL